MSIEEIKMAAIAHYYLCNGYLFCITRTTDNVSCLWFISRSTLNKIRFFSWIAKRVDSLLIYESDFLPITVFFKASTQSTSLHFSMLILNFFITFPLIRINFKRSHSTGKHDKWGTVRVTYFCLLLENHIVMRVRTISWKNKACFNYKSVWWWNEIEYISCGYFMLFHEIKKSKQFVFASK